MAESYSENEVSMAETSSDPEPGPSTSVTVANVDVPSLLSWLRCPTSSELAVMCAYQHICASVNR